MKAPLRPHPDGQTPLHYAVARNFVPLAKCLVDLGGASLLEIQDKNRETPLSMAR